MAAVGKVMVKFTEEDQLLLKLLVNSNNSLAERVKELERWREQREDYEQEQKERS